MLLLALTVVSLAVAIVMSVVAWRLYAEERRREADRVAALAEAIQGEAAPADDLPLTREIDRVDAVAARPTAAAAAEPGAEHSRARFGWLAGRVRPAAASLLVAAGIVLAVLATSGGDAADAARDARRPAPLELVALASQQRPGQLTVAGEVRNPAGALPVDRLTAVVFFFDRDGGFLTSARAPVAVANLSAGESSAFAVTLDAPPPSVARYRVSFRREASGIVPHVDRRVTEAH